MLEKAFELRAKSWQTGESKASRVRNGLETSFCSFLIFVARLRSTRTRSDVQFEYTPFKSQFVRLYLPCRQVKQ